MRLISLFELRHAWDDLKDRRWHDYPYAKRGDLLHHLEMGLRDLTCWWYGHNWYDPRYTWKRGCARCWIQP